MGKGRPSRSGSRPAPAAIGEIDEEFSEKPSGSVPRGRWLGRVLRVGLSAIPRARSRTTAPDHPVLPRTATFDDFYRSNYAPVVRLAYSLCGSVPIAEELAQEAFVTAHGRWTDLHRFDRPDLWVRRVVINRSISYRRRQATERRALELLPEPDAVTSDPALGDTDLLRALRELSPRQAETLALFYLEDQPLSEVAKILGLGEETVKTHLKRGRAALAAKLGSEARR